MANGQFQEYKGLCAHEVKVSRGRHGPNLLTQKKRTSIWQGLLENFGDPVIRILLIALGVNIVVLWKNVNWMETMGIVFAILIAVVVSTVSEAGSERAFERLRQSVHNRVCRVKREGKTVEIPVSEVVVGDVVLLSAGDKIPADGRILGGSIEVDQSALNGESKEAKKFAGGKGEGLLNPSLLFGGTVIVSGSAAMEISAVGDATFYGKIAADLQEDTPDSPLKHKLATLAKKISFYGYIGAGLVAFSYLFNAVVIDNGFVWENIRQSLRFEVLFPLFLNALTLAVSVIVMAVPEGLPMMITIVLSTNMKRMGKDNVLVRKLNGIETAGSLNILFTDKTGTLTTGKLSVKSLVLGDGRIVDKGREGGLADILWLSLFYNNAAEMIGDRAAGGNSTDRVLLEYSSALPHGEARVRVTKSTPFCSDKKYSSSQISGEKNLTLFKGAPEKILEHCTQRYTLEGGAAPISAKDRYTLQNSVRGLAECGGRMLAVAVCPTCGEGEMPKDLILVAVLCIRDFVRDDAVRGVREIRRAGIQTVMITGDAKSTAEAIAKEVGILEGRKEELVLTSSDLAAMSEEELAKKLSRIRVIARALPSDKSRLVRAAQKQNLVTGMTGDGINDAPALRLADIGFAMGSGTEVAKEAGDIVILDDNIASIARAVSYGRTIFKSIRKFVIFQLTINFCAVAVSVIAPVLNIDTPITVVQMLWINLVMDTLAGLAFGGEQPRSKYMTEPPKKRDQPIINKYMKQQIAVTSIYTALLSLWFLRSPRIQEVFVGYGTTYALTAFFALFMFLAIWGSLNARTHELNLIDHLALNKQFIWVMGSVTVLQIALIYFGGQPFRTTPLAPAHLIFILVLSFSVIPLDMLRKYLNRRGGNTEGT